MKNEKDIEIIDGVETFEGIQIFKSSDILNDQESRAWGKPIVNNKTYTVSELENKFGNKYYWVINDTAIDFLKAAAIYLTGGSGAVLSGFLSFLNGNYKARVKNYLSTIKSNGARGIYVKQVWECGPIYGYYVQGATTVNIVY
ncbi:MAG: hypothetical protein RSC26_16225 [Terrisporobacter sp.]